MTRYEEEILYPTAKKILKALGYDPDKGDVHKQFMERHRKAMSDGKPTRPKIGRPKKNSK